MTLQQLERLISKHKEFIDNISDLYDLGFDFHEGKYKICKLAEDIFTTSIEANYGKDGIEWVDWFIYETNYGTDINLTAIDADGNKICFDIKSLYDYLEKNCKL
jgi:imidazole glycerol phosphate synthase subunit HisF